VYQNKNDTAEVSNPANELTCSFT